MKFYFLRDQQQLGYKHHTKFYQSTVHYFPLFIMLISQAFFFLKLYNHNYNLNLITYPQFYVNLN